MKLRVRGVVSRAAITAVLVATILLVPRDADWVTVGLGFGIAAAVIFVIFWDDRRRSSGSRTATPREWPFWVFPLAEGEALGIAGAVHFSHPWWLLGGPVAMLLGIVAWGAGALLNRRHRLAD